MSDFRARLDEIAEGHSYETGFNGALARYRIRRLEEALGRVAGRESALEIGCGEGSITAFLARKFGRVHAIEPARTYFDVASQRLAGGNVTFENAVLEGSGVQGTFDLAVAAGVLEHVEDPIAYLRRARSHLDGGHFAATVPNATALHRRLGRAMGMISDLRELGEPDRRVGHYRYYDFATLRSDLEASGFEVLELDGIVLKPLPNAIMDTLSVPICDGLYALGKDLPDLCAEIFVLARALG